MIIINDNDLNNIFSDQGAESIIYYYDNSDYYDHSVLLKHFRTDEENKKQKERNIKIYGNSPEFKSISKEELNNKRKKLEELKKQKCLKDEITILDECYSNDNFIGYTMEKCDYKGLDVVSSKRKEKIKYLKLIKDKIEKLNSEGIFIGDFSESNFLTDNQINEVKLCDLDNIRIGNLDFDKKHRYINEFERKCKNKDCVDSFCFNMFTLAFLNKIDPKSFKIRESKLPRELKTKENMNIIESMINLDDSYTKKYLIDNLR